MITDRLRSGLVEYWMDEWMLLMLDTRSWTLKT